ncbi:MAG TPA: endonuclease III domain-containing protein [Candidatus Angelobacter sp.]|nr:endonuclease III domain-containing protein [Candidatus Angelobacter sp.]
MRRSAQKLPDYQITQLPNPSASPRLRGEITKYYAALLSRYGPQNWWPAQSRFEVIVGAYLTQNTNWSNVEKAIANLRRARALSLKAMREMPLRKLETLVRPSGFFRQKARRLKAFIAFLDEKYAGSLTRMFAQPTEKLRAELLELDGVGPETADSILLYAGNHPVFVVDAYTRRVLERHGIVNAKTHYEEIRALIENAVSNAETEELTTKAPGTNPRHPASRMSSTARSALAQHYNELHALIVRVGNHYCRTTAKCTGCPLEIFLQPPSNTTAQGAPESHR